MRFQAVLATPTAHISSDMLSSFDDALLWSFCHRQDYHTCFIYGIIGYRITEVYVLTDRRWRFVSC